MPKSIRRAVVFTLIWLILIALFSAPQLISRAAGCSGNDCTGLYAEPLGCGVGAQSRGATLYAGCNLVENRYSTTCNAEWEKTTNQSGGNRYAAGSIRYGTGFTVHQSARSPALISNLQYIYSPMKGPESTLTLSCGKLSSSGVIPIPVVENCVGPY